MRYLIGFVVVFALGLMGCSETSGTGGSRVRFDEATSEADEALCSAFCPLIAEPDQDDGGYCYRLCRTRLANEACRSEAVNEYQCYLDERPAQIPSPICDRGLYECWVSQRALCEACQPGTLVGDACPNAPVGNTCVEEVACSWIVGGNCDVDPVWEVCALYSRAEQLSCSFSECISANQAYFEDTGRYPSHPQCTAGD